MHCIWISYTLWKLKRTANSIAEPHWLIAMIWICLIKLCFNWSHSLHLNIVSLGIKHARPYTPKRWWKLFSKSSHNFPYWLRLACSSNCAHVRPKKNVAHIWVNVLKDWGRDLIYERHIYFQIELEENTALQVHSGMQMKTRTFQCCYISQVQFWTSGSISENIANAFNMKYDRTKHL